MNNFDFKNITENLIETFNFAGKESIRLFNEGLKIEIKNDKSPVSNGDLRANDRSKNLKSNSKRKFIPKNYLQRQ